jgi:hypothetical protein
MRRVLSMGMTISLLATLTACGGSETDVAQTTPVALMTPARAIFHAVPDDSTVVTGTTECQFSEQGVDPDDGSAGLLAVCELDMSDPRVSGTERDDRFHVLVAGDVGDIWVAEEAVITNEEGAWRGFMQAADDAWPCGEAHFIGEDTYQGLEFHYYYCDIEGDTVLKGWISGGG